MRDWLAEYEALRASDAAAPLPPEEVERLALAAFMLGHDDEVESLRERAFEQYLAEDRLADAVVCAFWLGFHLQNRGASAQAAGWSARLRRLVGPDGDPRLDALLSIGEAAGLMMSGQPEPAIAKFDAARPVVTRTGDRDAAALTVLGRANCLHQLGRAAESAAAVDEVMVDVAAGRLTPQVTGLAYCAMIGLCMEWYDLPRAREWTLALTAWVDEQGGLVPYRGACLVHRAELLQTRGAWPEAASAALLAREQLAARPEPMLGEAHYRVAEIDRVLGRYPDAQRSYELAAACGAEVQPGLAYLRLATGQTAAAAAGLDRALVENSRPRHRPALLAARIEVALHAGDVTTARTRSAELDEVARATAAQWIHAMAARARGSVLLAEGDCRAALPELRHAWSLWQEVDAPYEAARTRVLVAAACRLLGDCDAERMELAAARAVFDDLGAAPDLTALARATPDDGPLSPREREVLRLLATGATNRAIAEELFLSEKTVARHVSNIFGKLNVGSRSAATAYAFEHGLS